MTDIKKREQGKKGPRVKKLQLNKETLKDLSPRGGDLIKGGSMIGCIGMTGGCVTKRCG